MTDEYRNILVAVDASPQAKQAFAEAINIAKRNHGRMTLMTVIDTSSFRGTTGANSVALLDEVRQQAQELIRQLEAEVSIKESQVPISSKVIAGSPKREIVSLASQINADLIVMGATGLGAISQVLVGSTTAYVVNQASCNVMVIK
ncbi:MULTISPECIES: universal stress protein [Enterococcus]|uniref:Universal stress protein n=1 Tax=Enterococcus alishanensis TaxID=1303817 RepID=A0ABS6TD38_9ENTE|nr:universal stress protein [Enterococcus alishanensis]MBV7390816.1 universal stress protein [Enterococcus alishanensis]